MTNTLTISRELAQKVDDLLYIMTGHDSYPRLVHKYGKEWWTPINEMRGEICTLLAAPAVERQDSSALMKIAADLANRNTLRQLYLVCEHQGRINTDSLHEHLDKCGDLLAGIALDIRRAITSPPAPVAAVLPDHEFRETVNRLRAISEMYGHTEQLRERISAELRACLDKIKEMNR